MPNLSPELMDVVAMLRCAHARNMERVKDIDAGTRLISGRDRYLGMAEAFHAAAQLIESGNHVGAHDRAQKGDD